MPYYSHHNSFKKIITTRYNNGGQTPNLSSNCHYLCQNLLSNQLYAYIFYDKKILSLTKNYPANNRIHHNQMYSSIQKNHQVFDKKFLLLTDNSLLSFLLTSNY